MTKITSWATAAAAMAILAACEVTVNDDTDGGTTSSSQTSTSGGTAGSSSTSTTTTGSGGSGGSSADSGSDSAVCEPSTTASACEKCAFDTCMGLTCSCNDIATCKAALGPYLSCVSGLDGGDMEGCAGEFAIAAGATGGGVANELAGCMSDCEDRCQGRDAAVLPKRR